MQKWCRIFFCQSYYFRRALVIFLFFGLDFLPPTKPFTGLFFCCLRSVCFASWVFVSTPSPRRAWKTEPRGRCRTRLRHTLLTLETGDPGRLASHAFRVWGVFLSFNFCLKCVFLLLRKWQFYLNRTLKEGNNFKIMALWLKLTWEVDLKYKVLK